jgi:NitT/TauT family transport system substrate-binding protein
MKMKQSLLGLTMIALSACAVQAPPPRASGPDRNAQPAQKAMTKVRLPMGYIPNVQFAPYYVAVDEGYFAEEGIELEFDYKFETDGVKLVGAGELPFAVVSGEQVVLARSQGLPVKYFAEWYRKFPIAVFSLKDKNIVKPEDLKGKTVGLPGFFGATYVGWRAFLDANGLTEQDVEQQEIGFTQAAAVQQGLVDAAVGYVVNEPIVLEQNGFPVNVFRVGDQIDMVANGLLTNERTIRDNPALVQGMARALIRGIQDTIENPDAAMQIAAKYVEGLKPDDPIQKKVLLATIELMKGDKLGASSAEAWENTQNTLLAMGQTKEKKDVNSFFTNEFLP